MVALPTPSPCRPLPRRTEDRHPVGILIPGELSILSLDEDAQNTLHLHDLLSRQVALLAQTRPQQIQGTHLLPRCHLAVDHTVTFEHFRWNKVMPGTFFGIEA